VALNISEEEVLLITNYYAPSGNVNKNDKFFIKMKEQITRARREELSLKKVKIIGLDFGDSNSVLSKKDRIVSKGIDSSFCHKGLGVSNYIQSTKKVDAMDFARQIKGRDIEDSFTFFRNNKNLNNPDLYRYQAGIDHVFISKGYSSQIIDCKVIKDSLIESDHRMICTTFNITL